MLTAKESNMSFIWVIGLVSVLGTNQQSTLQPPASMVAEHEEIHRQLVAATKAPGKTGAAARELAKVLHSHFEEEQRLAIPPLGALRKLAAGKHDASVDEAVRLSTELAKAMPKMLQEHVAIRKATQNLLTVAQKERRPAEANLAKKLRLHAQNEEEVTYPAALLVAKLAEKR